MDTVNHTTIRRQTHKSKSPKFLNLTTALKPGDPDDGDKGRQQRGIAIAAVSSIKKTKLGYSVVSQSGNGRYAVNEEATKCECPDFELRGEPCKHIYAVQVYQMREDNPAEGTAWTSPEKKSLETETVVKKPTYKRDWSLYNKAQVLEEPMFVGLLRKLCDTIEEPKQEMGRRRIPLSDRVFAMTMKVYSTKGTRRSMAYLEYAIRDGLLEQAPDFSSITRWMEDPEMTPLLVALLEQSALPFAQLEEVEEKRFAVDSTGFTAVPYHRWFDYKHGKPMQKRQYIKAHFTCGVKSKIITSAVVTPGESSDSKQMPRMVKTTAHNFTIDEYSGDMAYLSRENLDVVVKAGGKPFIPYKVNSVPRNSRHKQDDKMDLWEKLYYYWKLHREEWLEHYHQRSNVEACVWMAKSKLGSFVRSKTPIARVNECYVKLLSHNLIVLASAMIHFGIDPTFQTREGLPMAV